VVAGDVEPADQHRQLLQRVVMDVGRDAGSLRLGGGSLEVRWRVVRVASRASGRSVNRLATQTAASHTRIGQTV